MYSDVIREREELSEQIRALKMLKELAKIYGCDIGENTVVLRCTGKFYAAQFHDELVDDLLNLFLRECTLTKVALCIDV